MTAWRARLAVLRARSEGFAEIYTSANSANSADSPPNITPAEAIGAIGANGIGIDLEGRAAFLLRASGHALAALAGPEMGPVLQVGQMDHDAAERVALVGQYAAPAAQAGPAVLACFPCGRPMPQHERAWSAARGWCCTACRGAAAGASR